jgi:hypothetical protein
MTLVAISNVFGRIHAAEVNRSSRRSNCHIYTKCLLVKAQHQKLKRNITPNFKDNGMALVLKVLHLACLP